MPYFAESTFAKHDNALFMSIDGFHSTSINHKYPHLSTNVFSRIRGNVSDTFPFALAYSTIDQANAFIRLDSLIHVVNYESIGSEVGDEIFSPFNKDNTTGINRDHNSKVFIGCGLPYSPVFIYGAYRYIDMYSDRFDRLRSQYEKLKDVRLPFSNEGLALELITGYVLRANSFTSSLKATSYGYWAIHPYFFSPYYIRGNSIAPRFDFLFMNCDMSLNVFLDQHHEYEKQVSYTEYADHEIDLAIEKVVSEKIKARFNVMRNSVLQQSMAAKVLLIDTVNEKMVMQWENALWSSWQPTSLVSIDYSISNNIALMIKGGMEFVPASRKYRFLEFDKPVDYYPLTFYRMLAHTEIVYQGILFFPYEIQAWVDFNNKPLWESIENAEKRFIITQTTSYAKAATTMLGGSGEYTLTWQNICSRFWATLSINPFPKNIVQLSLPRAIGIDLSYGNKDVDSFYGGLRIETRDRVTLRFLMKPQNSITEYTAPAQTFIRTFIKIPFVSPVASNKVKSNFQIEAGPLHFSKQQRVVEHPMGNYIGPSVSLSIQSTFN